ncbi:MAG: TIGR03086 family metal-binding protein [Acidimicrobiia bacterium]
MAPADHDAIADRFGAVVDGVTDWDAPTPVAEWRACDVVGHLTTWFPEFLASGGIEIAHGDSGDPVGSWHRHDAEVRALLAARGGESFTHPYVGTRSLADTVAQFYTADVFLHTWDLARASGQDDRLDATLCEEMYAGMSSMGDMLRSSGQFGEQQPVRADAGPQERLIAFIGRDPYWTR